MCLSNPDGGVSWGEDREEFHWEMTSRRPGEPIPRPLSELRLKYADVLRKVAEENVQLANSEGKRA